MKLSILALTLLAGIATSTAIAGRAGNVMPSPANTKAPAKPAAMGCCAMGAMPSMAHDMDCHASKDGAVAKPKSCCK
jgi:hypothetical protein